MASRPVGDETLEMADGDGCSLASPHTFRLALVFLRAHPTGHGGQCVVAEQGLGRRSKVAVLDMGDERGDVDHHRATLDTCGPLARQTALRLEEGEVLGEPEVDLVERPRPLCRVPRRHVLSVDGQALALGERLGAHAVDPTRHPDPRHT